MINYDEIINGLTVEDAVGQLMCVAIPNGYTIEEIEELLKE